MGGWHGCFVDGREALWVEEIVAAYRRERDAVRRSHFQVIWLLLEEGAPTRSQDDVMAKRETLEMVRAYVSLPETQSGR